MKNKYFGFKILGLVLCLSAVAYATEFELKNEASIPLKAVFGSAHELRLARADFIVPGETFRASIDSQDYPQLVIIVPGGDYMGERFEFSTTADVARLKIVNSYSGKVALEPQDNSISKNEIIKIASGSINGSAIYTPEPKPAPAPSGPNNQIVLAGNGSTGSYTPPAPQSGGSQSNVSPYSLLGIPQNADDSKILGVDKATLKVAALGTASAKSTVKKAFLKHSLIWHPDKINSSKAQEAFKKAGVTDPNEQKQLANDVFALLSNTYEKYK